MIPRETKTRNVYIKVCRNKTGISCSDVYFLCLPVLWVVCGNWQFTSNILCFYDAFMCWFFWRELSYMQVRVYLKCRIRARRFFYNEKTSYSNFFLQQGMGLLNGNITFFNWNTFLFLNFIWNPHWSIFQKCITSVKVWRLEETLHLTNKKFTKTIKHYVFNSTLT